MSDQKTFAKFPALGSESGYQYVDIFQIEGIGQSTTPEAAVIFMIGSERFYQVMVDREELDRAGEPDAASWCLSLMTKISRIAQRGYLAEAGQSDDRDDEDDFTPPAGRVEVPRPE